MKRDTLGIEFSLGLLTNVSVPERPKLGCELSHMVGILRSKVLEPSHLTIVSAMGPHFASFHANRNSRAEAMHESSIETPPTRGGHRPAEKLELAPGGFTNETHFFTRNHVPDSRGYGGRSEHVFAVD
jgi:hypothetical protein